MTFTILNYGLVLYQTISEPKPIRFTFFQMINSQTSYICVNSDIDGSYENYGYVYASSWGFEMKQPQPQPVSGTCSYTVGLEYNCEICVGGTVEFTTDELNESTSHSSSDDIFSAWYSYSCLNSYSDCDYREVETYQIGMYLIDWTASPPTNYKRFINEIDMTIQFADGSGNPLTILWSLTSQSSTGSITTYFWG